MLAFQAVPVDAGMRLSEGTEVFSVNTKICNGLDKSVVDCLFELLTSVLMSRMRGEEME